MQKLYRLIYFFNNEAQQYHDFEALSDEEAIRYAREWNAGMPMSDKRLYKIGEMIAAIS